MTLATILATRRCYVRAARRRLDPSGARRVFGPRVAVLGDAQRPLPGARPCAERVGFAVLAIVSYVASSSGRSR
jgi:hypothetical protein